LGNKSKNWNYNFVESFEDISDLVMVIVAIIMIKGLKIYHKSKVNQYDLENKTYGDYSVRLSGLPTEKDGVNGDLKSDIIRSLG
jgi:hypothetical protein